MKHLSLAALLATTTLASAQDIEKMSVDVRPAAPRMSVLGPPIIVDELGKVSVVKLDGNLAPAGSTSTVEYTVEKVEARMLYSTGGAVEVDKSVSWEKLDTDLKAKGFGGADIVIPFGSRAEIDKVASDIRTAVGGVAQAMLRRPPTSTDFQALRDALRPAGLERFVDEAESADFSELRDLHDLWERVVDALLDRAIKKYERAASNGRITRARFYQIQALLSERAAAAQNTRQSTDTYRRLAALMAQVEANQTSAPDISDDARAQFQLELVRDRLQRVMSYLVIAAERGFVPAGWHQRLGNFLAHRARLGN